MKRKLRAEDQVTLAGLRERMLLTLDFVERAQPFPSSHELKGLVEKAAEEGSLRDMKMLARTVEIATLGLEPHQRDGLEALLEQRLGIHKDRERAEQARRAATAIKRGSVASEKERRHLEDYAEMLEANGGDPSEIAAVRRLLSEG